MEQAIYKGEDVTGRQYGLYVVLGCVGKRKFNSGSTRAIWRVLCLGCNEEKTTDLHSAMRQRAGCPKCRGKAHSAQASPHWRGGKHVPAYFVAKAKQGCTTRARRIEWNLDYNYLDQLWESQQGKCAYTGWIIDFGTCSQEQTASLDRIDSSLGYVPGNVQFVHKDINTMKWSLPEQRFLSLCEAVVNNAKSSR